MPPQLRCKLHMQAELRAAMQADRIPTYACPTLLRGTEHCGTCVSAMLETQGVAPMPVFHDGRLIAAAVLCCFCESDGRRPAITQAIEGRHRAEQEPQPSPGIIVNGGEKLN